jgi:hypothetical protein
MRQRFKFQTAKQQASASGPVVCGPGEPTSFFSPRLKPKGTERRLAPRSRARALRHGSTSCERCAPSGAPSRLCLFHLASGETGPRADFLGRDFDGYYPLWVSPSPADEAAGRSCCRPAGPRGLPGAGLRRPCARAPHHRSLWLRPIFSGDPTVATSREDALRGSDDWCLFLDADGVKDYILVVAVTEKLILAWCSPPIERRKPACRRAAPRRGQHKRRDLDIRPKDPTIST